ncbi:MAG TPA: hypothetical protein VFU05_09925 [Cyclobacteriaceae bacterium]|nr:hypothetical protein [Cyclobacteriaceae bacterium]
MTEVQTISKERWDAAQIAERSFHKEDFQTGYNHYAESYRQYFQHLGIDYDLQGKNIVEIGPADFPALAYCKNAGTGSIIIEPMPSEHLKRFGLTIKTDLAEDAEYQADEVWLLNVLQHVMNPYEIVERAKKQASVIRFFEPINYGIDDCHPWNLTMDMFREWFGEVVKYYPPNQPVKNFHTWECAYGVWIKK